MKRTGQNSKYIIWLYDLTAKEFVIIKNYFNTEYFETIDIENDSQKFKEIKNNKTFENPDIIICDEQTELTNEIRESLYNASCGIARVTLKNMQKSYIDKTFELTSEKIPTYKKQNGKFIFEETTKIESSFEHIVDIIQLSNITKIQKEIKKQANSIRNNIEIDKVFHDGETFSQKIKEYLFKLSKSLNTYINFKDNYTAGHCERVSIYSELIGRALKLSEDDIENLILTASLHDIGKLAIPDAIISKTTKLNDFEFELMKKHVALGSDILPNSFSSIKSAIRGHHEKLDGTGYPDGLKGDEIVPFAQIIAIADAFDAMTSQRSYNQVKTVSEALKDLELHTKSVENGGLGYHYNPQYVNLFINAIKNNKEIMDFLARQKEIADANYLKAQMLNNLDKKEKGVQK